MQHMDMVAAYRTRLRRQRMAAHGTCAAASLQLRRRRRLSPLSSRPQGALLCLAAATVGLGEPTEANLRQIVPPVLASFTDQDSRWGAGLCL